MYSALSSQVLYPLTMAQIMGPRYKAGSGRDDLDAELLELMGVVRLRWVWRAYWHREQEKRNTITLQQGGSAVV